MGNIFVTGIHGVGKTTFCDFLSRKTHLEHFSCSKLIGLYRPYVDIEKCVDDINKNQRLLLAAYKKYCYGRNVILDGHTTILDSDGRPVCIDANVFQELDVSLLIYMEAPSSVIQSRVKTRSGIIWDKAYIDELVISEKKSVESIAEHLNIDLLKIMPERPYGLIWDDYRQILEKF